MASCDHEEADTRLIVHIVDALTKGRNTCLVRTVDTDIVMILVGKFHYFTILNLNANIWVAFGSRRNFPSCTSTLYAKTWEERNLWHCHFFTAFSSFRKGKRLAWEAWKRFPNVSTAFVSVVWNPFTQFDAVSPTFKLLERFTIVLYSKNSNSESIDDVRMELFCQDNKAMDSIPPTADALLQHAKRAAYQASVWTSSQDSEQRRQHQNPGDGLGMNAPRNGGPFGSLSQ